MSATATTDTDRTAALDWLFERVILHVTAFRLGNGSPYEVDSDDVAMRTASQEDCFGWLDDCEARLGCDVAGARAAMTDFLLARDGGTPEELNVALREALGEARGRMHANHPIVRGLAALAGAQ